MIAFLQEHNGNNYIVRNFVFIERDDITREIKKNNPDSITDKFELQRFIQNNHKKGNYLKLKNKMIALENALSKRYNKPVDPVVYMISLYYKDNLGIRDISARISLFGVNIPKNTVCNMFTNIFSWKLRAHNEGTIVTEKKNKVKPNGFNKERTAAIKNTNSILVTNILKGKRELDIGKYEFCRNHSERVSFVLDIFSLAKNQEESRLYIRNLQKEGNSMESIAFILTTLFNNLFAVYPQAKIPKLTGSEISKMYFR